MYAVIATGGKQERVEVGTRIAVEILPGEEGTSVDLTPLLIVDGDTTLVAGSLGGASVTATIVGDAKGPKIKGYTYKAKARVRRRYGHRQHYTLVEVTDIAAGSSRTAAKAAKA